MRHFHPTDSPRHSSYLWLIPLRMRGYQRRARKLTLDAPKQQCIEPRGCEVVSEYRLLEAGQERERFRRAGLYEFRRGGQDLQASVVQQADARADAQSFTNVVGH